MEESSKIKGFTTRPPPLWACLKAAVGWNLPLKIPLKRDQFSVEFCVFSGILIFSVEFFSGILAFSVEFFPLK